jgi:hypothetical protein
MQDYSLPVFDGPTRVGSLKVWYHSPTMVSAMVQVVDASDVDYETWEARKKVGQDVKLFRSVASISVSHRERGELRVDYDQHLPKYASCMRMLVMACFGLYPGILDSVEYIRAFSYGHLEDGVKVLVCPEADVMDLPRKVPRRKTEIRAKKSEYAELYGIVLDVACHPEDGKEVPTSKRNRRGETRGEEV